jgi:hypothetical protein
MDRGKHGEQKEQPGNAQGRSAVHSDGVNARD